jgi:hypothetical protein
MGGKGSKGGDSPEGKGPGSPGKKVKRKGSKDGSPERKGGSPEAVPRGSKRRGSAAGLAAVAKAKSASSMLSLAAQEADPAAKWEKVRDDLRMEVAHSELAAKAVETQSERLAANIDKVEKECAVLYKKLKGLKKQLKKVGAEKDDIEEYLQELAVEHEEAFDQADTKVNAVDAFHLKKFVGAGKKLKNQNVFLKAMAGGRKR